MRSLFGALALLFTVGAYAAPLTYTDSLLDRMLANNGIYPGHYSPETDGPPPQDYGINGSIFARTFLETHFTRFDDHVEGGPVIALEDFWNILPGGEGETEINWLLNQYNNSVDRLFWVEQLVSLFSTIEVDASVGDSYRIRCANGYCNKQNLKDWVNAIP